MDKADVECFELFDGIRWEQDKPVGDRSRGVYWATTAVGAALDFLLDMGDGIPEVWTESGDGSLERFAVSRKDGGYYVKSLGGPDEFAAEIKAKIDSANAVFDDFVGKGRTAPGGGYRAKGDAALTDIVPPPGGSTAIGPVRPYEEFWSPIVQEPLLRTEEEVRAHAEMRLGLQEGTLGFPNGMFLFTVGPERGRWMIQRLNEGVLVNPSNGDLWLLHRHPEMVGFDRDEKKLRWYRVEKTAKNLDRARAEFMKGV
jgi:hypothetical protein